MTLMKENIVRKIDGLGRLIIPKGIRARFEIYPEDELEFFIGYEGDDVYICLKKYKDVNKAEILAAELEGMGIELPEKLRKMLDAEEAET